MRARHLVNSLCESEGLSAAFRRHGLKTITEDGKFATYTAEVNKMVSDLRAIGYRAINALKPSDVGHGLLFCVVVLLYGERDYEGGESVVISRYNFDTSTHARLLDSSIRIIGDELLGDNPTAEEVSAAIKRLTDAARDHQTDIADEIKGEI